MRGFVIALVLVGCHPPGTGSLAAITTLDHIAPLSFPLPEGAVEDCRPSTEVRRWFAHALRSGLRPCGSLELAATADQREVARRCVVESIERAEPFLVEQQLPETDGVVAYAVLGTIEYGTGTLVVYRANYEAPRCTRAAPSFPTCGSTSATGLHSSRARTICRPACAAMTRTSSLVAGCSMTARSRCDPDRDC